jgi:hypothetical protein
VIPFRWYTGNLFSLWFISLLAVLTCVLLIGIGDNNAGRERRIAESRGSVTGTVVSVTAAEVSRGRGLGTTTEYTAVVAYASADGHEHQINLLPTRDVDDYQVGQAVAIVYDSKDATNARAVGSPLDTRGYAVAATVAGAIGVVGVPMALGVTGERRAAIRQRKMQRDGRGAEHLRDS